jgi:hypothetical protein
MTNTPENPISGIGKSNEKRNMSTRPIAMLAN